MAMDINNNYGGYYGNTLSTQNKESTQSSQVRTDTLENSKDNVQEYYENLCKKFPRISFNIKGGIMYGSENKIVLNLSKDCLKKMADDPEFAKEIENNISGIPTAHNWVYAKAKSDGIEIHGFAVRINADGSMQCSCEGSTKTANTGQSKSVSGTKKQKDERMEKSAETRKKRKERAEKAAEKREEKKAEENKIQSLLSDYTKIVTASTPKFDFKA